MIEFRHDGKAVRLEAGDVYRAAVGSCYRDAPENELRSLTHEVAAGIPWREAVRRKFGNARPWLAKIVTDPSRDLFFRMHPPVEDSRVLDVGAGWGQISLPLGRVAQVTALEPNPEKLSFLQTAAEQEVLDQRMQFVQADFLDLEFTTKFDLVACIGVLEWIPQFRAGDPYDLQVEFLRRTRSVLSPGGRLVVGIENRLGLKYLLGANDDHTGRPGISVLDRALASERYRALTGQPLRVFTYSQEEYRQMLSSAGFAEVRFFAAFPDYKLPEQIIPFERPGALDDFFKNGRFVPEHDGITGLPLPNQEELRSHYGSLARMGISQAFAPSYYISAS
jgi:2-polyprenyl-3-methyl-5-hydroxy-6-metoxy-1,4-benzoquinol methylase